MYHASNPCGDVLCRMVLRLARAEICTHYEGFLTVKPVLQPYCVKLMNICYSPGECPKYILEFDLYPYIFSHITISVCRLVVSVDAWEGEIKLVELRQLRSFPVPQDHWDCVCQPF